MDTHGCWFLTGERIGQAPFAWHLTLLDAISSHGLVFRITLKLTPPPDVRNRPHAFRILEDLQRDGHLPWASDFQTRNGWWKCLLDLDNFREFIRPYLPDSIQMEKPEECNAPTEDDLMNLTGRALVPAAVSYGSVSSSDNPPANKDYLEFHMMLTDQHIENSSVLLQHDIADGVREIRAEHASAKKRVFVMMRFSNSDWHSRIYAAIRKALAAHDMAALRADERAYDEGLLQNVRVYLQACDFGIAVFEQTEKEFSPNVALEVGYLMALGKKVCLLKDSRLRPLQDDLAGRLYEEFDGSSAEQAVPRALESWLKRNRLI